MNKTLKSILSLVLCVCFVLALSACGKQNNDTTANNTDTNVSKAMGESRTNTTPKIKSIRKQGRMCR